MSGIFISHSSKDAAASSEIHEWLKNKGHQAVFLDFDPADGIPAGRNWERELYQQIRSARAMIVLCSPNSMDSRWCFMEITHARALGKQVFPVLIEDCKLDGVLTDRQVVDFTKDREGGYERLWQGLLSAGIDPKDAFDWDASRPPYPGLLAFQERDAAVYFGRDAEIREGLDKLNSARRLQAGGFAMVVGSSGSGKSSLVRAGLVPRLRRDVERWIVTDPFRPRTDPAKELSFVLARAFAGTSEPRSRESIQDRLSAAVESGWDGMANPLGEMADDLRNLSGRSEAKILLIVDQFEEMLGRQVEPATPAFLRLLREAAEAEDSSVVVLGTMRSDFLGAFQTHPSLVDLQPVTLSLGPLSSEDVVEVIQHPADLAGITFESGLVQAMAADTALGDALPLLAFTLRELVDRFGDDREVEFNEYRRNLGGLEGALATVAEEALQAEKLGPDTESQLRAGLLAMVRLGLDGSYVRRVARWSDLPDSLHPLLARLVNARLLVSDESGEEPTLEVAHEALFRSWDRLQRWISDSVAALRLRRDVVLAAEQWAGSGKTSDELWFGTKLSRVTEMLETADVGLDESSREFIRASVAQEEQRKTAEQARRRRTLVTVSGAGVVSLIMAVVAFVGCVAASESADREKEAADKEKAAADAAISAQQEAETEKAQALVSLFQGLIVGPGTSANAGSLCTEENPRCEFSQPVNGTNPPPGPSEVTVLGSIQPSLELVDPSVEALSRSFVLTSRSGEGRVVGYAHDGSIFDYEDRYSGSPECPPGCFLDDNTIFFDNSIRWAMSSNRPLGCVPRVEVALHPGWVTEANTTELANLLRFRDWDYFTLDEFEPLAEQLRCVEVLIWGNRWDGVQEQTLIDVVDYVHGGGGLLLGGLGWSWLLDQDELADYPTGRLAATFGFAFTPDMFVEDVLLQLAPP